MSKKTEAKPWIEMPIDFDGKNYNAEYYVDGGVVHVTICLGDGLEPVGQTQCGSSSAETVARMLALEFLRGAKKAGRI